MISRSPVSTKSHFLVSKNAFSSPSLLRTERTSRWPASARTTSSEKRRFASLLGDSMTIESCEKPPKRASIFFSVSTEGVVSGSSCRTSARRSPNSAADQRIIGTEEIAPTSRMVPARRSTQSVHRSNTHPRLTRLDRSVRLALVVILSSARTSIASSTIFRRGRSAEEIVRHPRDRTLGGVVAVARRRFARRTALALDDAGLVDGVRPAHFVCGLAERAMSSRRDEIPSFL
jgi:hypothetical protein